jgi:hypothetical protein
MKRIASETRKAGMPGHRRCFECGGPTNDDGNRCPVCRPRLSDTAKAIGEARRCAREEVERVNREIANLDALIWKLFGRLK